MIELTRTEFNKRLKRIEKGVAEDLRNALLDVVPVDTGLLKTSIKVIPQGKGYTIVMAKHGLYVEFGTPPHVIRPKNKKALHWGGKGGPVVKEVHHPGTAPNPFVRSTIHTKLKDIVIKNIKRHLT